MKVTVQSKEEHRGEARGGREGAEEIKDGRGGREGGKESFGGSPAFPVQIKSSNENSLKKKAVHPAKPVTKHS